MIYTVWPLYIFLLYGDDTESHTLYCFFGTYEYTLNT